MNDFWLNKKILITGHTGFKGGWLSVFLHNLGSKLFGISNTKEQGIYSLANLKSIFEKEWFIDLGKVDTEKLTNIIYEIKPDIIFHFAAQAIVSIGYSNPIETIQSNSIATLNLLLAIEQSRSCNSVVVATTDKVYKSSENNNIESDILGGSDIYSISKVNVENIISYYNEVESFQPKISKVRSGNVLGGGDRGVNRLTTDIVNSFLNNQVLYVRNLNSIRPWQYVLDSIYGYLLVAEQNFSLNISETYNLNSKINNKYTVDFLINEFQNNLDYKLKIKKENNSFKEKNILLINSDKARNQLNWSTETKLEKTVEKIVHWEIYHSKLDNPTVDYSNNEVREFIINNDLNYKFPNFSN